ncbi:class I SAM-dependent methyltransferase [Streptomyces bathyalis]|uniref:Class I SAM-dependent methyltransferase n=1 Tax=Streptomyces bathyalis TaxID=2710756 RepID=A0A7T1T9K5_9ACTN|nr:methyltransferase domain-containing protein [Streptomyces bathyalis]QPP08932.1 class I SAM-dependent methyltransferase [Streptomyces bathyalis]
MSLRHHEIAEAGNRILNPFTEEKLRLLGTVTAPRPGARHLDLACGKGEMLSTWARDHGTEGIGVDISRVFLEAARERAAELGVAERLHFERADAGSYEAEPGGHDLVTCLGATWIGGGLAGTLELMRRALRADGTMVVGEVFWRSEPSDEACRALEMEPDDFASLAGTNERFEAAGLELVEMVLADPDSWDRYAASQWRTVSDWLCAHPEHPDAPDMRDFLRHSRTSYLAHGRDLLGWGAFVLRPVS